MSYNYTTERPSLFTDEGQRQFLKVRDKVNNCIKLAGAVRMDAAIANCIGSSWEMLACVDRMVELKEIVEVTGDKCAGQYRIFTRYD